MNGPKKRPSQPGGPPAERLREQLEREFGEVPAGSPLEEDQGTSVEADDEGGESPPHDTSEDDDL